MAARHRRRDRAQACGGTSVIIACSALKRAYRDILVQGHSDTRIVYLRGDKEPDREPSQGAKRSFHAAGLLESQLTTLEEPTEDERPLVVDIDATVDQIADRIVDRA